MTDESGFTLHGPGGRIRWLGDLNESGSSHERRVWSNAAAQQNRRPPAREMSGADVAPAKSNPTPLIGNRIKLASRRTRLRRRDGSPAPLQTLSVSAFSIHIIIAKKPASS
jgi:hypothetical protein